MTTKPFLDESTVADHHALYLERGRAGVESLNYPGRVSRLSADQRAAWSDWIAAEVPRTAKAVCAQVQAAFLRPRLCSPCDGAASRADRFRVQEAHRKRKVLIDTASPTFALFTQAFDAFFQRLHEHDTALARLVTERFHLIGKSNAGIPCA